LVLVKTVATRQIVVAASEEAQEAGIGVGLTLAHARALCPSLQDAEHDPAADHKGLEALARWMMRFGPVVALHQTEEGNDLPAIFLDATGLERLFGGLGNLLEQVRESLRAMGLGVRVAIAPSLGSAWAIASAGEEDGRIVRPEQVRPALSPLPVRALRLNEEIVQCLYHLGIETIGQLLELPRRSLLARFGEVLLRRIDQALGRLAEPLVGLRHEEPIAAQMEFDGVVDSLEAIWRVFGRLIEQVVEQLKDRGCGARRLEVEFSRPYAPAIKKTILLSRPSRKPTNLFNLMRCAMETLEEEARRHGGAKARRGRSAVAHAAVDEGVSCDGFTGVKLSVPVFEKLSEEQVLLLEAQEFDGRVELEELIERLCLRLGPEGIAQAELLESYIPEKAWAARAAGEASAAVAPLPSAVRPLHLLQSPEAISVMVSPSHDLDGRPISFTRNQQVHRIIHSIGPERIAGEWWEGRHKTRDYFMAEDEAGQRWWVFRVVETRKWYVHGSFE
jgi:protein ImuB